MKKLIFYILTLLSLNAFGQKSEAKSIIMLSQKKNQLMIDKDTNALKKIFTEDIKYIHSNGKIDNLSSLLNSIGRKENKIFRQDLSQPEVRLKNKVAILVGNLAFSAVNKENKLEYDLVITEVWLKKKKKWVLWTRHASRSL